jgi:hypothetical protein
MQSVMHVARIGPVGYSRIGSLPNPRRNTSKEFFEAFGSSNKATTCCSIVTALKRDTDTLLQLCCSLVHEVETKLQHRTI